MNMRELNYVETIENANKVNGGETSPFPFNFASAKAGADVVGFNSVSATQTQVDVVEGGGSSSQAASVGYTFADGDNPPVLGTFNLFET